MLSKLQFGIALGLSVLALVLAIFNAAFSSENRALQIEIATHNQYIQQSLQLEPLYQGVIRSLVDVAANHDDVQIRDLLVSQGITFKVNLPNKNADRTLKQ